MNDFIKHFLQHNKEEVLKKSLLHCHAKNLHSVMLLDSPHKIVRMFIAEPGNNLWMNDSYFIAEKQSIAFHSHHCDLTIKCLHGEVINRTLAEGHQESIPSWKFTSKIKTGKGSFKKDGEKRIGFTRDTTLVKDDSIFLRAKTIHTVATLKDQWAAWLVFEGKEDKNYDSICYSFSDLTKFDFSGLYKKMTQKKLNYLLKNIRIL